MGTRGLAEYFVVKYAGLDDLPDDTSLGGAVINGDKVRVLKDGIQRIYSEIQNEVTALPLYDRLNVVLADDNEWNNFHKLIINLTNYVEDHTLLQVFTYAVRLIDKLVKMRADVRYGRYDLGDDQFTSQDAMKRIGNRIWEAARKILNLHEIRDVLVRSPEAERILGVVRLPPAWDFGNQGKDKIKNPNEPFQVNLMRKYDNSRSQTLQQFKINEKTEKALIDIGMAPTKEEIAAHIDRQNKDHHNEINRKHVNKYKAKGKALAEAREALGPNADEGKILAYISDKEEKTKKIIEYLGPVLKANGTRTPDDRLLTLINYKIDADINADKTPRYSHGIEMDISNEDLLKAIKEFKAANAKYHADKLKGK